MEISREFVPPTPPPIAYNIALTADEFQVLKAAVAVTKFEDLKGALVNSSIEEPTDLLYRMHCTFTSWDWKKDK